MIPPGFIQELLSRVDIVEVVGRHVELKKAGINHKGLCPFHGERSPSFIVSASRQTYHCFGCGVHGDALSFLIESGGLGFVDAVHELAQRVGLQVPDDGRSDDDRAEAARQKERRASVTEVLERAADHFRAQLKANPRAVDYLKRRGLTGAIAARFGMGYAPEGWRSLASAFPSYDDPVLAEAGLVIVQGDEPETQKRYDRFRDRIMFPIRSVQGDTIGFGGRVLDGGEPKYLNSPETPVFVKGRELYGLFEGRQAIRARGHALVVEGYMDVVALAQCGIENAVATLGTACTAEHVSKLFRFTDGVVFSFDGDAAGRRASSRALEAALPHASDTRSIRFLFLPPEHDPDSFVREHGADAFQRQIDQSASLSRQLVDVAREDCDLGTPEGRAKFLSQAKPLWSLLPDGGLRRQMLSEIARKAELADAELAQAWAATSPATGPRGGDGEHRPRAPTRSRAIVARATRRPRSPEDHVVHMLFTHGQWWNDLSAEDLDLLHALPAPHGELLAWLEREIAEHGARPWAVVQAAVAVDEGLAQTLRQTLSADPADDDAEPGDLRAALNMLLLADLDRRLSAILPSVLGDAKAREAYQSLAERRRQLKSGTAGATVVG